MRTVAIAGFISLILVLCFEACGGPRCEPGRKSIDFGKVPQFEEKKLVVKVKNGGDSDLEIGSVRTCCGFSAKLRSDKPVPPGGSAEIQLTCKPLLKTGTVKDKLLIVSNDPERPRVSVPVKAEVVRQFAFAPKALNFGMLDCGQTKTLGIKIDPSAGGQIRDVELAYPEEIFVMKCITPAEGAAAEIRVSVRAGAPVGRFSSLVEGSCVTDRKRPIAFYVHGSVIGKILVMPAKLILGSVIPDRSYEKTVRLVGRNGRKFRVLEVKCDSESIRLKTAAVSESEHTVTAELVPAEEGSNFRALITVSTNDQLHKTIQIPVLVLYRK